MGSPKYIINNGRMILGIVESHEELASDHSKTVGGGWWHVDQEKNILYLFSASTRFGVVTKEVAEAAWGQFALR